MYITVFFMVNCTTFNILTIEAWHLQIMTYFIFLFLEVIYIRSNMILYYYYYYYSPSTLRTAKLK